LIASSFIETFPLTDGEYLPKIRAYLSWRDTTFYSKEQLFILATGLFGTGNDDKTINQPEGF